MKTATATKPTATNSHGRVYDDLKSLVAAEGKKLSDENFRAYRVAFSTDGVGTWCYRFVATNSPANAAQACVELERVPQKELLSVALSLLDAGE